MSLEPGNGKQGLPRAVVLRCSEEPVKADPGGPWGWTGAPGDPRLSFRKRKVPQEMALLGQAQELLGLCLVNRGYKWPVGSMF